MERMVIEVDDLVAKAWNLASEKKKKEIALVMEQQLSRHLLKDGTEDYLQFLDELRDKMSQRGLTAEILDDI